jgi:hypothetical protein
MSQSSDTEKKEELPNSPQTSSALESHPSSWTDEQWRHYITAKHHMDGTHVEAGITDRPQADFRILRRLLELEWRFEKLTFQYAQLSKHVAEAEAVWRSR